MQNPSVEHSHSDESPPTPELVNRLISLINQYHNQALKGNTSYRITSEKGEAFVVVQTGSFRFMLSQPLKLIHSPTESSVYSINRKPALTEEELMNAKRSRKIGQIPVHTLLLAREGYVQIIRGLEKLDLHNPAGIEVAFEDDKRGETLSNEEKRNSVAQFIRELSSTDGKPRLVRVTRYDLSNTNLGKTAQLGIPLWPDETQSFRRKK